MSKQVLVINQVMVSNDNQSNSMSIPCMYETDKFRFVFLILTGGISREPLPIRQGWHVLNVPLVKSGVTKGCVMVSSL